MLLFLLFGGGEIVLGQYSGFQDVEVFICFQSMISKDKYMWEYVFDLGQVEWEGDVVK